MWLVALAVLGLQAPPASPEPTPDAENVAPGPEYRLGPDDVLKITVYGHEDLTLPVVVEGDGTFVFPLIGRVQTSDLSPRQLEQTIAGLLAQGFIRDPQVTVVVQTYRSRTVFVMGELTRPGSYPLSEGRTLIEILSRAGPFLPTAGSEVLILRSRPRAAGDPPERKESPDRSPPAAEVIRIDLEQLKSGSLGADGVLRPGDTVFVPRAARVFVSGGVRYPGAYPLSPDATVRQAITLAGGFSLRGVRNRIRVVRAVEGSPREIKVGLDDRVLPGDTVIVMERSGSF